MSLDVSEVDQAYSKRPVLHKVSLTVRQNEVVGLLGHNGAGKTTVLRVISGLTPIRKGGIAFDGHQLDGRSPLAIVRRGISYAPQGGSVFTNLTIQENLELGAYAVRSRTEIQKNLDCVLSLFPHLHARRNTRATALSGGERQMLGIGISLMASPRLLLLDEPSGALAPAMVRRLFDHIRDINRELGVAVLLVEQNVAETLRIADRLYVLTQGAITYDGSAKAANAAEHIGRKLMGF
jgi:branched-chain amino acid transport system ATP-binding protein